MDVGMVVSAAVCSTDTHSNNSSNAATVDRIFAVAWYMVVTCCIKTLLGFLSPSAAPVTLRQSPVNGRSDNTHSGTIEASCPSCAERRWSPWTLFGWFMPLIFSIENSELAGCNTCYVIVLAIDIVMILIIILFFL
ncbi:hypothetical protein Hamer_G012573 [Homarus americanus]|uniref:Uncharacterized protein n=1 Tax=Homarus americanus TaxID=6706 RepID=A0A8J5KHQ3_HOMAM|nr:hypothetical protein Hamer_G012573 [Homarus americanus]